MKLDYNQIKSLTRGAERITETDKGICFYRFSLQEEAAYASSDLLYKTFGTAGVCMEFKTDAQILKMRIDPKPGSSRTYFLFDVFVDDDRRTGVTNCDMNVSSTVYPRHVFVLRRTELVQELGKGEKTVKIVFPWSVAPLVEEISLGHATFAEGVKRKKTLVAYGDSITQGYDVLRPSAAYANLLSDALDAELFNKGVGGEIFFPGLARAENGLDPDYITVAYGTNDWIKSKKADFENNCRRFLEILSQKHPGARIFAISPIWRADWEQTTNIGSLEYVEDYIKSVCSDLPNVNFVSGWNFVPHDKMNYADLELHPNDRGNEKYFKNLIKNMKRGGRI